MGRAASPLMICGEDDRFFVCMLLFFILSGGCVYDPDKQYLKVKTVTLRSVNGHRPGTGTPITFLKRDTRSISLPTKYPEHR